ncbi:MAG: NAD-dependent epimerase/dehydratase family protein [Candidatus Aminicenantes bacterium]|nr:NAD-dependent epimerase/dehydratase family protein [Candidatus Aminicenantes bacterium]
MNVFITGVNGFIGSHLARYLKEKGNKISGCSIEAAARDDLQPVLSGYSPLFLNRDFDPGIFKNIDCLVHCAYSYERKNIEITNIAGTKKMYHAGKDRGVKKHIFLTSYSAKPGSQSEYGFIKYELENFFLQEKQVIIRPGLVLGSGGMFQGMMRLLKTYPVIPLLDGGAYDVPIISVGALCQAIEKILTVTGPAQYHIFQAELVSMKHLLLETKRRLGARCLLLPIPSFLPRLFLKLLETLRIPFPIKSSSIVALKENRQLSYRSHLKQLGIVDSPLEEILRSIKD